MPPLRRLKYLTFKKDVVQDLLGESNPAKYLFGYLRSIGTDSILLEPHYVDRHYLDDFQSYYSLSFRAPSPVCSRLHFFALSEKEIRSRVTAASKSDDDRLESEEALNEAYRGFVVRRPLADARIGRTVLKTYLPDGFRRIEVVRPYRVNVAGLELRVDGLAYQEQDQGAAVCASTALWSALQRVSLISGDRTPTPSKITEAAGSPFPAAYGLNDTQMKSAIAVLGYSADYFEPSDNRTLFRAQVASCLKSQLPVVLLLSQTERTKNGLVTDGHAVALTGYRQPNDVTNVVYDRRLDPIPMRSGALDVVYVHDDNLGSHAHYELFDVEDRDEDKHPMLRIYRGRRDGDNPAWWSPDEWDVFGALVPKYRKIRLPIDHLFWNLIHLMYVLRGEVFPAIELHYSVCFSSGVEYKQKLEMDCFYPSKRSRFVSHVILPRHIGLISAYTEDVQLCDVILDASEISPAEPHVLGMVGMGIPANAEAAKHFAAVARDFKAPCLVAKPG